MILSMRPGSLTVALVAALALSACAPQGDEDPMPKPTATRTVVTTAAVPLPRLPHHVVGWPAPPLTVDDNEIHVGSRTIDVSPLRADMAVSTRGGIYFLNAGELWFLDEHGAVGTGFARMRRIAVSADGRYLGLIDRTHGPVTDDGPHVARVVVYDTTTGRPVLHSRVGMGAGPGRDLRQVYEADPPTIIGFEGDALVAATPKGRYAYPISGAAPRLQQ